MQPERSVRSESGSWIRLGAENAGTALAYWGIAHLAFVVFKNLGILPMPFWPSAAVAIVMAFYRGWRIAPGIAAGAVLANHFSLGGPWPYALGIAVMNTVGPLCGAAIMRQRVSDRIVIGGLADLLICFVAIYIVPPMLAATGGIGFKYFFGMIAANDLLFGWLKWTLAHALGNLLCATPIFAWFALKESWE